MPRILLSWLWQWIVRWRKCCIYDGFLWGRQICEDGVEKLSWWESVDAGLLYKISMLNKIE